MSESKKYWGSINLNEIKNAIESGIKPFEGKKGKYLDVQVYVNDEPDQFGNSLSISCYNKETKQATYLGNLKLSNYNDAIPGAPQQEPAKDVDLPF